MMRLLAAAAIAYALLATAIHAVVVALVGPADAQAANCADHGVMVETLADRFGEGRVFIAFTSTGRAVETFANPETGTWTITVTAPGGPTCLVASGGSFILTTEPAGQRS